MSCNSCPLRENSETALAFDSQKAIFDAEVAYRAIQAARAEEWRALAEEQPVYFEGQDELDEREQSVISLQASLISVHEVIDKANYLTSKPTSDQTKNKTILLSEEIACPGPIRIKSRRFLGRVTLECASESRQTRAREFEASLRPVAEND